MESPHKEKRGLIWSLIEAASDSNTTVRKTASNSLIVIGQYHPDLVLSLIRQYLDNPHTSPKAHIQSILYNTAEGIIRESASHLNNAEELSIWVKKSEELLILPTISLDLQQSASNFLVALGCSASHVAEVMTSLINVLKPDEVPPQSIVDTLAALASANSQGTAVYFNKVLSNLISCLENIKQDNLRLAISSMLAKFSEAVIDAVANKDPLEAISIEMHHDCCSHIYNLIVTNWLKTTNLVVKNEIILCLGHMSFLLPKKVLEMHVGVIIVSIIGHYNYKRNPYPFTLTFSLALICDAVIKNNLNDSIKLHIEAVLGALFNQVCIVPNYNEPLTVKNYCEVLRCYEILDKSFSDNVVTQLIQRLENASYMQRAGALLVIKHLINSRSFTGENIDKIIFILIPILSDPNSKVVKSIAQVIVALCHNGHLTSTTGPPFILYLVQHSAGGSLSPARRSSLNEVGEEVVADVCCRALNLLATSVSPAVPLLWPHLLQFVTNVEYQNSLPTVLTCLAHLSSLPNGALFELNENSVPFPGLTLAPSLVTRLLILCCTPVKNQVGQSSLSLLLGLAKHISPSLEDVWSSHLPQLKSTYNEIDINSPEPIALQMWQDSLCDFLGCSIQALKSDTFVDQLIKAQMDQLDICDKNQAHRCFIISLIGVSLKYCSNKAVIDSTLDALHHLTNHKSSAEQESFSLAVGLCGSSHIDQVLSHIESWLKASDMSKRSLSLLFLLKSQDGRLEESIYLRSSIVLSLGQIAILAPPAIIGNQIDGPIMLHLLNIINSNKSDLVNDVILQSTSKIAKSLLKLPNFRLRQRPLFLTHIVNTMKMDHLPTPTLASCLQVLRDLTALEPELNVEERTIILQASLTASIIHLQESLACDSSLERCYSQLNVLVRTIIQHDTNPATLDDITTLLHTWTISPSELVRIKAMDLLNSSFCTYLQHLELTHAGPTSFNQTCQLLSMLTPRCADSSKEVRIQAVICLSLVLKIAGRYNGQGPDYTDDDLRSLKALQEAVGDIDMQDMGEPLILISKVICNKLNFVQLRLYLSLVVVGLQDLREEAAIGVAQIMSAIFTMRGHQLHQHIKEILDSIYGRLEKVSDFETRYSTVEAICNLSKHNITTVIDTMMKYPVPYERGVCETFQRIGCESDLCLATLTHLTHILERNAFFTEYKTACQDVVNIATLSTLTAICAMKELLVKLNVRYENTGEQFDISTTKLSKDQRKLDTSGSRQVVNDKFPCLTALLLMSYGSYIGTIAPLHQSSSSEGSKSAFVPNRGATNLVPSKCVLDCLKSLVSSGNCILLEDALNTEIQSSSNESLDEFVQTLTTTVSLLVKEVPQHISSLVAYLDTHHNHEMQRVTVTTLFGQLVAEKCCGDIELLEIITTGLLSRLNDKSVHVRRLSVRGLANFAMLECDQMHLPPWFQVNEKLNEVVSALVGATDLREGSEAASECQVTLEALKGLASVLPNLPVSTTVQHAATLLIRIRLFVEKSSGVVREAAVGVLRGLALTVGDTEEFREHIYLHLLTSLIHLEDSYQPMIVMCKSALQAIGPHLQSDGMNAIIQEQLSPSSQLNFSAFIQSLSKYMASDMNEHLGLFIQATVSFFRHTEASIRKAAIILVGNLIFHSETIIEPANLQRVSQGLYYLLRDSDASVRTSTAYIIPLLHRHQSIL